MEEKLLSFRRLRWSSPWMVYCGPAAAMGLWFLIHQIWNGFIALSTICGLALLGTGLPACVACLQTVEIGTKEIRVKLGSMVVRRIPKEKIKTLAGTTVSLGRGGSCTESLIILSPKPVKSLTGSCRQSSKEVLGRYFADHFIFTALPREEGLWLYYSSQRATQIAEELPKAVDRIT